MTVHLREITADNRAELAALTVSPAQADYVAGVAESLAEAADYPQAAPWFRGVYAGDTPVGFVMISDGISAEDLADPELLGPYFLWRLLIDQRHQGHGYGAAAVRLVVDHLRANRPDAVELLTSCGRGPGDPYGFYLRLGFTDTGTTHQGETVLTRPLR